MPERRTLAPALRELDDALATRGMPRRARDRVGARLRQEALRREATSGFRFRWLPALTFAAGAALVLMVVGVRLGGGSSSTPQASHPAPAVLGMFTVQGDGCRHHEQAPDVELRGACLLSAPHMVVHTWDRVRLRSQGAGTSTDVRLVEGTAMFDVTKVEAGASPTRIPVSHGVIEVLGTRFTIEQGPHGGHVDLFEGRIRFIDLQGVVTEIAPGQRHSWGDAVAVASPPPPEPSDPVRGRAGTRPASDEVSASGATGASGTTDATGQEPSEDDAVTRERGGDVVPSKRRADRARPEQSGDGEDAEVDEAATPEAATADDATAIIDEVTRLRAQGRYVEAASVLRRADRERRWDARTAQVLSYELGEIIERHLDDRDAACEHWARHAERWPSGRYARAVNAAQERLGCPAE